MTAPYLVLVGPRGAEATKALDGQAGSLRCAGWTCVLARDGLQAWTRPERPMPVTWCAEVGCLLLGRIFPRVGSVTHAAARNVGRDATALRRARWLCAERWGSYVAVFPAQGADPAQVLRDPSGAVEAFTWRRDRVSVLASALEDAPANLRPSHLALDWDVIADFVRRPVSVAARSALEGLSTIVSGDLHALGETRAAPLAVWRPTDWLPTAAEPDADPSNTLAEAVSGAVAALGGAYSTLVSEASGGLDSSIVNACLGRAGQSERVAAALHYVGDLRESDEQAWAQCLCARWDLRLERVTRPMSAFDPETDFAPFSQGARPPVSALDAWRDQDTADCLTRLQAGALVTGTGGDGSFFQMPTPAVLCDLWMAKGATAFREATGPDVARWLRRSVWSVWRDALTASRQRPPAPVAFAGPRVTEPPIGAAHPWLDGPPPPPAKALQIQSLAGLQVSWGRSRRSLAADLIQPLLSQPVMEACLSIPAWVLVRGGRDRGLAREAFGALLPAEIVARRSKGALTSLFSRRVAASLDALRPYLLDGVLADAGVLDRAAMDTALDADRLLWRADGVGLIRLAALESWVRHWQTRAPDRQGSPGRRR